MISSDLIAGDCRPGLEDLLAGKWVPSPDVEGCALRGHDVIVGVEMEEKRLVEGPEAEANGVRKQDAGWRAGTALKSPRGAVLPVADDVYGYVTDEGDSFEWI